MFGSPIVVAGERVEQMLLNAIAMTSCEACSGTVATKSFYEELFSDSSLRQFMLHAVHFVNDPRRSFQTTAWVSFFRPYA